MLELEDLLELEAGMFCSIGPRSALHETHTANCQDATRILPVAIPGKNDDGSGAVAMWNAK